MTPKPSTTHRQRRARPAREPAIERLEDRALLTAAALASIPDLAPQSDSGWSPTDNKTSITKPTFTGTASNAAAVWIFDGPALLGSTPVIDGRWSFTAPTPLANGRHAISARAWALGATQPGQASKPLVVTVNTVAPLPTTPRLAPIADSGFKGDGRTNVAAPTLVGRGQPGTIIAFTAVRGASSAYLGAIGVPATGSWRFQPRPLTDGVYTVTTSVENAVGLRTAGASLSLTIDTVPPVAKLTSFAGLDTITISFSKPVAGATLRNLWISGWASELGVTIPSMSLSDTRVRSILGNGAITISPDPKTYQAYTVRLPRAFAEPGTYTLTLVGAGIRDWAGNRPADVAVPVSV
jgi:hypothetical protein